MKNLHDEWHDPNGFRSIDTATKYIDELEKQIVLLVTEGKRVEDELETLKRRVT